MNPLSSVLLSSLIFAGAAYAGSPIVTNVQGHQITTKDSENKDVLTKDVQIDYDLEDTDSETVYVTVQVSGNSGEHYDLPMDTLQGDVGDVVVGPNGGPNSKSIIWKAGVDWNRHITGGARARVIADDTPHDHGETETTEDDIPVGMGHVPSGFSNPGREVFINGFYMDITEVAWEEWVTVYNWAIAHGYTFSGIAHTTPSGGFPVVNITWHEAVKWCNAKSEMNKLRPCYYTSTDFSYSGIVTDRDDQNEWIVNDEVYRGGIAFLNNDNVNWEADGHRLPTRAEWLRAYWGGLPQFNKETGEGNYFPWPSRGGDAIDHIDGSKGNYIGSGEFYESNAGYLGLTPVGYYNGSQTPVGTDMANGGGMKNVYGIYDLFGNVAEWNWDRYIADWYDYAESGDDNSHGPSLGTGRKRVVSGAVAKPTAYADFFNALSFDDVARDRDNDNVKTPAIGFRTVRNGIGVGFVEETPSN